MQEMQEFLKIKQKCKLIHQVVEGFSSIKKGDI